MDIDMKQEAVNKQLKSSYLFNFMNSVPGST